MEYDVKMGESRKEDERIGRKPERMLPRSYDLTDGVIPIHQVAPGVTTRQLRGCQSLSHSRSRGPVTGTASHGAEEAIL